MARVHRDYADDWLERRIEYGAQEETVFTPSHLFASRGPGKRLKQKEGPRCDNCGLETEYLFDGFIYPVNDKGEPLSPEATAAMMALSAPFQVTPGQVCFRCRPPSNLEVQELLKEAK